MEDEESAAAPAKLARRLSDSDVSTAAATAGGQDDTASAGGGLEAEISESEVLAVLAGGVTLDDDEEAEALVIAVVEDEELTEEQVCQCLEWRTWSGFGFRKRMIRVSVDEVWGWHVGPGFDNVWVSIMHLLGLIVGQVAGNWCTKLLWLCSVGSGECTIGHDVFVLWSQDQEKVRSWFTSMQGHAAVRVCKCSADRWLCVPEHAQKKSSSVM